MVISSGVMWTAEVKEALLDRAEHLMLIDAMGSTEGGMGNQVTMRGLPVQTAKFTAQPETKLFSEDGRRIEPGSGEMGMVAAGGNVPLGYYKDPEKSARTFKVIDGVRYSFPGDWGYIEADGTLTLLGRGSQCINTGGEKVYPEEVEEAVKLHPAIEDCLVVGVPDEKFGERIVAVAALVQGGAADEGDVIATAKAKIAAYKAPKQVIIVEHVPRAPNGKADYKTAKQLAVDATDLNHPAGSGVRRSLKNVRTWFSASCVGWPGSSTRCSVSTECAFFGMPWGLPSDESISTPMNRSPSSRRSVSKRSFGTNLSPVNRRPSTSHPAAARTLTAARSAGDRPIAGRRDFDTAIGSEG